jgi:AcrR family transcriptional regulator
MSTSTAADSFTPTCDSTPGMLPRLTARRRPRQARSHMTVTSLLDATARVLVRRGYAACTTNLVAEVAGVGIGSLYEYFPNKEALVAALAEREIEAHLGTGQPHEARAQLLQVLSRDYPYFAALPAAARLSVHERG